MLATHATTSGARFMKTVLIIGGYGGFGARLSRRLSKAAWRVVVAGRRLDAAKAFSATVPNCEPVVADRNDDLSPLLNALRPDLVIDAAGPFQGGNYAVPLACIDAKISYLDLADARDFVCGIGALDSAAKSAGVSIVSGASSVPALSGAVVRSLVEGLTKVKAIEMAISASNRATAGPAVSASILSYAGKPVKLWRGGRWHPATGWHMLTRAVFEVEGCKSLNRLTALAEVPDHTILPDMLPDHPSVTFRAGPEFSFQVLGIWALSFLVKWGWIRSLSPLANWLRYLQMPTNALGSDCSAMFVEVKGFEGDRGVVRRWTLIAQNGDGPEIPTLACVILAGMTAAGELAIGARDASTVVSLDQFAPQFESLSIHSQTTQRPYTPLYQRIMGDSFAGLPRSVASLHRIIGNGGANGESIVKRGTSWIAGLICNIMAFPQTGKSSLHVGFEEHNGIERWTRDFGGCKFSSCLSQSGDKLIERFGPLAFRFDLASGDYGLEMVMLGWSALGIPLPLWFAPKSQAREWQDGDDFCFDVHIDLPFIGHLVHYQGRLRPS